MKPEQAHDSPWAHVLLNAIGKGHEKLAPEVYSADLSAGDTIILCTDGLSQEVNDGSMVRIVRSAQDPNQACKRLVEAANEAGGSDNITVIVATYSN